MPRGGYAACARLQRARPANRPAVAEDGMCRSGTPLRAKGAEKRSGSQRAAVTEATRADDAAVPGLQSLGPNSAIRIRARPATRSQKCDRSDMTGQLGPRRKVTASIVLLSTVCAASEIALDCGERSTFAHGTRVTFGHGRRRIRHRLAPVPDTRVVLCGRSASTRFARSAPQPPHRYPLLPGGSGAALPEDTPAGGRGTLVRTMGRTPTAAGGVTSSR